MASVNVGYRFKCTLLQALKKKENSNQKKLNV